MPQTSSSPFQTHPYIPEFPYTSFIEILQAGIEEAQQPWPRNYPIKYFYTDGEHIPQQPHRCNY